MGYEGEGRERAIDLESRNKRERAKKIIKTQQDSISAKVKYRRGTEYSLKDGKSAYK